MQGTSISLITGRRVHTLGLLERRFGVKFEERRFPPAEEMEKNRTDLKLESLIQSAEAAICDGYLGQAQAILEHEQAQQIVAYLLRSHADRVHDEQRAASNRPRKQSRPGGRPGRKRRPRPGRKKRR
jgi:hypothetical protein